MKIQSDKADSRNHDTIKIFGRESRCGTYLLRIRVNQTFSTSCGRFKSGKRITFTAGDYLYIGSAMAEKGSVCLARRLVRHASRLGTGRAHPIRDRMLTMFPTAGLCDGDITPSNLKRPKWNVDHPLDHSAAELTAAYLLRTSLNMEAALAKLLENDRGTVAFEPGLGANDVRGNTHLLRVDAGEEWWDRLPKKLNNFMKLSRMSPERASEILARVASGTAFSRADRETQGMYDTVAWDEISSRLWRGRGCVLKAAAVLQSCSSPARDDAQRSEVARLASEVKEATNRLRAAIGQGKSCLTDRDSPTIEPPPAVRNGNEKVSFSKLSGWVRVCAKLVAKSARDIPRLRQTIAAWPAADQLKRLWSELSRIEAGADQALAAVTAAGSTAGRASKSSNAVIRR